LHHEPIVLAKELYMQEIKTVAYAWSYCSELN